MSGNKNMKTSRSMSLALRLTIIIAIVGVVLAVLFIQGKTPSDTASQDAESSHSGDTISAVTEGKKIPDYKVLDIEGRPVQLHQLNDKPIWLIFNATWCAACRAEAPEVKNASQRDDIHVVSVYVNEQKDTVKDYSEILGFTHTQIADTHGEFATAFQASAMPTHFFIGQDGVVVKRVIGAMSPQDITTALEQLTR